MRNDTELIPHLFRTEYSKITAVLTRLFGFEYMEIAEDIASDTFMTAAETWGQKGLPDNPRRVVVCRSQKQGKRSFKAE